MLNPLALYGASGKSHTSSTGLPAGCDGRGRPGFSRGVLKLLVPKTRDVIASGPQGASIYIEREREKERQTDRQTQRERQTDRQTYRETDTDTDTETDRQTDRQVSEKGF